MFCIRCFSVARFSQAVKYGFNKEGVDAAPQGHPGGPRVLSGYLTCYGAATSQVLAIYENFQDFVFSVLLLSKCLSLRGITHHKKGSVKAW